MDRVTVVMPCRNEAKNLPYVLDELPDAVREVIIVDGASSDNTIEVARLHRPDVVILDQPVPGKGAASITGLLAATGDVVVLMDGDDSMDPADIKVMLEMLVQGADVVHASRELGAGGSSDFTPVRRLGNQLLTATTNALFSTRWTDLTYGYVAMWADVIPVLALGELLESKPATMSRYRPNGRPVAYGHGFEIEVLTLCRAARAGLLVKEVPSFERKRRHGTSNLSASFDGLRVAKAVAFERFGRRPSMRYDESLNERMKNRIGN